MPYSIEWHDSLSTDIVSIDADHKKLLQLLDGFEASLRNVHMVGIRERYRDLLAFVTEHFALEERVMRNINYPDFEDHKRQHEILLKDATDFLDDVEQAKSASELDHVANLLEYLVVHHMVRMNSKIGQFLHRES